MNNQGNTGAAKSPVPEKTPGTSRGQEEEGTGNSEELGQDKIQNENAITEPPANDNSDTESTIRNPSGDDLSNAVRGDEGSGRNI